MSDYPRLLPQGELEAQAIIDHFKSKMKDVAEEALGNLYVDCVSHIESDAWTNFRNQFFYAFRRLDKSFLGQYNLREMALAIAKEFPEELADLINQHHKDEIARLTALVNDLREYNQGRMP